MKRLMYDRIYGQYVIVGEPQLLVLGLDHGGVGTTESPRWFSWVNEPIQDIETPDELIEALKGEPEYIEVEAPEFPSDPPARALVVKFGRLAPHVGFYPDSYVNAWGAVNKLVAAYFDTFNDSETGA